MYVSGDEFKDFIHKTTGMQLRLHRAKKLAELTGYPVDKVERIIKSYAFFYALHMNNGVIG